MTSSLLYYSPTQPSSYDPAHFDHFENHVPQSLIHSRLATIYKGHGEPFPQLAETWSASEDGKVWSFKIIPGLRFPSGAALDAAAVEKSLKRIFLLMKKSGSKSDLLNSLSGVEDLKRPDSSFAGVQAVGDILQIRTTKPYVQMVETLSFGVFSVISPLAYDHSSGELINEEILIKDAFGPYEIKEINQNETKFRLKSGAPPFFSNRKAYEEIIVGSQSNSVSHADLAFAQADSNLFNADYSFIGRGSRNILYAVFPQWHSQKSIFSNLATREAIRDAFAKHLQKMGVVPTRSFFPLVMPGITEPNLPATASKCEIPRGQKLIFNDPRPSTSPLVGRVADAFDAAISDLGFVAVPVKPKTYAEMHSELDPKASTFQYSVMLLTTGVSIEDPDGDVRLMFSREGIWLPDTDGRISKELKANPIDTQRVNQLIYEQAAVFPLAHYDKGLWARKSINLKDYNSLLSPGEFQWISKEGI